MLIAPEGGRNAGLFVKPVKFERVWGVPKGVNKNILWVWRPLPPSDDYVALGFVGSATSAAPPALAVESLRCVHRSLVVDGSGGSPTAVPELTITSDQAEDVTPLWRYRGKPTALGKGLEGEGEPASFWSTAVGQSTFVMT